MLIHSNASALFRRNTDFLRNVATVMTGRAAAQILSVLLTPIISRLYLPEHYGVLALFISLLHMVNQWCALSYNQAIVIPKEDKEAVGLVGVAGLSVCSVAALALLAVLVLKAAGIGLGKYEKLDAWLYLIPALILISGLNRTFVAWNTRKKWFKKTAAADIASIGSTGGVRITAGWIWGSNVPWLIAGMVVGLFVQLLILLRGFKSYLVSGLFRFRMAELWSIAKKYKEFPIYNMPNNLIVSFSLSLPVLMLGVLFNPAIIGFYAMTQRVINMPVVLLSLSTRRVLEQKMAELQNGNKSLKGSFLKTTLGLALLSILPALILVFAGKLLFVVLLGGNWSTAGTYAAILTPWLVTSMMIQPANSLFVILMCQKTLLCFQGVALLLIGLVFLIAAAMSLTPEMTLMLFATIRAVMNILIIIRAYFYVK